jgi:colanic acid biosynthesis protein WcaH
LGIEVELGAQLGIYSHFWDSGAFDDVETTHTVNIVYRATTATPEDIELDDQHNAIRFVKHTNKAFHDYVNAYLRDAGYPEDRGE